MKVIISLNFARCTLPTHKNRQVKGSLKRIRHYGPNWFNFLIVCPFGTKSGKYYSRKRGKLMKRRTVISLGFI